MQDMEVLCYNGLNFLKVCMGKKGNRHFSLNFDIFAIKMTHLNVLLSFLLPSRFSAQSEAFFFFWFSSPKKEERKTKKR